MGNFIGGLLWLFIAWKVGTAIGNSISSEIKIMNEKAYSKKVKCIKEKYYPGFSDSALPHERGPKVYERYNNEVNELRRKNGKKEITYTATERDQKRWEESQQKKN